MNKNSLEDMALTDFTWGLSNFSNSLTAIGKSCDTEEEFQGRKNIFLTEAGVVPDNYSHVKLFTVSSRVVEQSNVTSIN
mgnify:CR=1 FL=1